MIRKGGSLYQKYKKNPISSTSLDTTEEENIVPLFLRKHSEKNKSLPLSQSSKGVTNLRSHAYLKHHIECIFVKPIYYRKQEKGKIIPGRRL